MIYSNLFAIFEVQSSNEL